MLSCINQYWVCCCSSQWNIFCKMLTLTPQCSWRAATSPSWPETACCWSAGWDCLCPWCFYLGCSWGPVITLPLLSLHWAQPAPASGVTRSRGLANKQLSEPEAAPARLSPGSTERRLPPTTLTSHTNNTHQPPARTIIQIKINRINPTINRIWVLGNGKGIIGSKLPLAIFLRGRLHCNTINMDEWIWY